MCLFLFSEDKRQKLWLISNVKIFFAYFIKHEILFLDDTTKTSNKLLKYKKRIDKYQDLYYHKKKLNKKAYKEMRRDWPDEAQQPECKNSRC